MDHGAPTKWAEDLASGYKTRLGLWMFLVYGIIYAGFVIINSVRPELMAKPLGQLNLAIIYGMGLIIFALIMAVIYNALASREEEQYEGMFAADDESEEVS